MKPSDVVILILDDERHVLSAFRRVLRREGYGILTAESAAEGTEILRARHVDIVMSDQRMPGVTGVEFLSTVKLEFPDVVRVIASGYAEVSAIVDAINRGEIYRFVPKPWDDEMLKFTLEECVVHAIRLQHARQVQAALSESQHLLGEMFSDEPPPLLLLDNYGRCEHRTSAASFVDEVVEEAVCQLAESMPAGIMVTDWQSCGSSGRHVRLMQLTSGGFLCHFSDSPRSPGQEADV